MIALLSLGNIVEYRSVTILFFIPAVINFSILIYSFKKQNEIKVNTFFSLFVCLLGFWQIAEFFMRLSETAHEALQWYRISEILILFILLYGNLFVFRFTGLYKKISSVFFFFLYILPIIVFFGFIQLGLDKVEIISSNTWSWIANPQPVFVTLVISFWMALSALSMLIILWVYYFKAKKNSPFQHQLFLLAIGLTFPIIIGIIIELLFPLVFGLDDVPVTAPLITIFSITSFIAIAKYNMLDFSPRHHWSDIVESISEGIIITNSSNEIMYVNKAFCNLVDFSNEQLTGKKASMISCDKANNPTKVEVQIKTKKGTKIWILWSETPYRDANGIIIGSIGICTNIHHLKEAENNMKMINEELGLYIYKSSHDLRGPIASMLGLLNLWKMESKDNNTQISYLSMLELSAKKLDEALVSLERAMRVKEIDKFEDQINFKKLIEEILIKLRHFPGFDHLSVTYEITVRDKYLSNKFILDTILQNIIENAIKYQDLNLPNSYLRIRISEIGNEKIELYFEDNGIGIDPNIQSKVFEMYFRGNLNSEGSGLGLYLVKKSVEKLKGEIRLESKVNQGSKFIFTC